MNEQRSCGLSSGVEFKNLAYKVQLGYKKGYKEILKSINGRFPSNKLIGILGGSGSGKSTLLNLLSGYEEGKYSGTIRTYGVDEDLKQYRKKSVYIMQDNYLQDLLTLRENMEIAADLKLGDRFGCYAKKAIIDKVISVMGLKDAIDTKTGILSGGEKKRLSVGLELINEPSILFLDEPTTGLDSSACTQFMEHLKELTVEGKTIICTIHQPSATVFNLFDEIYILQDGSCFYRGKPEDLLPCLENNGWTCPLFHNPADFAIELSINNVNIVQESVWECEEEVTKDEPCNTNKVDISDVSEYYSFKVLMKREFLKCIRNKTLTYLRLITSVMNSLTLSVIFWKVGSDASKMLFNYNFIMGFLLHLMTPSLMLTILTYPNEKLTLFREHFNRWFSLKVYYLVLTLIELPIAVIYCIISNAIVYVLTDQPMELWRFGVFTSLGFLIIIVSQSLGLLVGILFDVVNGTFFGSAVACFQLIFGGFCITYRDMPHYLSWFYNFSFLKYGAEGMIGSVMGYERSALPCPKSDFCQYTYPEKFIDDLGINANQIELDFVLLIIMFVALRIIIYLILKMKLKRKSFCDLF